MAITSLPFLSYIQNINIDKHVKFNRNNCEENLKIKIIVPLLEALGWDLLNDMDFERSNIDIIILNNGNPSFVVEIKSWGKITDKPILNQCFEYAIKSKVKWILLTNGQQSEVYYTPHLDPKIPSQPRPVFEFNFRQLLQDQKVFEDLLKYIGKDSFAKGCIELHKKIETDHIDFKELSRSIVHKVKGKGISDSQILEEIDKHNPFVRDSINKLWQGFKALVEKNQDILNIEYGTKEITLKVNPVLIGRRSVPLIRINFSQGKTWLYKPGWYQINCGNIHTLLKQIKQQPSHKNWAKEILELLDRGIIEIRRSLAKIRK